MHGFGRHKNHSVAWMTVLALLVIGIIVAHLVGFNYLKNIALSPLYILPALLVAGAIVVWHIKKIHISKFRTAGASVNEADVVTRDGLHWHPEITIYVKEVKQEIPQTGITNMDMSKLHALHKKMQAKHMHDGPNEQGTIHLRFEGVVRRSDITLGQVFKKWGKDIHSYGANLRMTVNGKENTEYENYVMQDKDKIELHYE